MSGIVVEEQLATSQTWKDFMASAPTNEAIEGWRKAGMFGVALTMNQISRCAEAFDSWVRQKGGYPSIQSCFSI